MAVPFEKTATYTFKYKTLVRKAIYALKNSGFKIRGVDYQSGIIHAKAGFSFWSFGEKIQVQVNADGMINAKSEGTFLTKVFNWQKNKEHVDAFFQQLGVLLMAHKSK